MKFYIPFLVALLLCSCSNEVSSVPINTMNTSNSIKIPNFKFREPEDSSDEKLLSDVHRHGWHVVGVAEDEEGPGFGFTVGLYLRTLQPEILIMGLDLNTSASILNSIGEYVAQGGKIIPGKRYNNFLEANDVIFRPINHKYFDEYLGYANWFYKSQVEVFPAFQCIWPDANGKFPDEEGFQDRFKKAQVDLSK